MNFNFGTQNDPILNLQKDQILDLSKYAPRSGRQSWQVAGM